MAVAALIIISSPVFAYQTTIDVGAKECFFERLATTDKWLAIVNDEVDGGFRDLAFSLDAPEGGDLVSADDNDPSSSSSGRYNLCRGGRGRVPLVLRQWQWPERSWSKPLRHAQGGQVCRKGPAHADRLSLLYLAELGHRLKFAKYESEVAATALVGHHQFSEQVNLFVTGWAVFELLLLMAASFSQVIYLRSLFERRCRI
ncbi:Transmembrane emp24 domain-containing protein 2 [Tyrophagus putrescentiae]|nr:Transmembrane emp24 domain-containing protein 2 [Tyrophagus putrescentiae]